jgi:hypothetical protein
LVIQAIDHENGRPRGRPLLPRLVWFGVGTLPKERLRDEDSVATDAGELKERLVKFAEETDG